MNWIDDKLTRASDWASGITPPTDEQLRPWLACHTLPDLGACMAEWLTGRIDYSPLPMRVRPEPVLRVAAAYTALVKLCRAGAYVTTDIDPDDPRAAVAGYVTESASVIVEGLCRAAGLEVRTRVGCTPFTKQVFGRCTWGECVGKCQCPFNANSSRELETIEWCGRHRQISEPMAELLENARQMLVFEPEPGRDDRLWRTLERVAQEVRP